MLVTTLQKGERFRLSGSLEETSGSIQITLLRIGKRNVRVGIEAPPSIAIHFPSKPSPKDVEETVPLRTPSGHNPEPA